MKQHKTRQIALLWFLIFCLLAPLGMAQDWPQWRGPDRDGGLAHSDLPSEWPAALEPLWNLTVGTGHASPVVADGRIYLHTRQDEQEVAACIDLATQETLWRKAYPVAYEMNPAARGHGKGPKSTPVLSKSQLYTLGISGILSCFDAQNGDLKWRQDYSDEFSATSPLFGTAMSPVVDGDRVIAHVGGHDNGAIVALDTDTGELAWRWDGDGPGYTSPIVVEVDGIRQIITQTQKLCIGLDADTGRLLWSLPFTTPYDQNIVTPVFHQQKLILSGLKQGTMALKLVQEGGAWRTEQIWHNPDNSMYMSSPVVQGDLLFGMSPDGSGRFFCLNTQTGETQWVSPGKQGKNAALLAGGEMVLALTDGGKLIVFRSSADAFAAVAEYSVAETPTWAHHVVFDKHLLVKDTTDLQIWELP